MSLSLKERSLELNRRFRVFRDLMKQSLVMRYASMNVFIEPVVPDFLCIGAPRTGTTWLYRNLMAHPDVFLPKRKELHFFDEAVMMECDGVVQDVNACFYKEYFEMDLESSWRWYAIQFMGAGNKLKGDITPAYSRVGDARVKLISERMPDVKVMFMMRDPVERAWSGVRNFAIRNMNKHLDEASLDELIAFTMQPRRLMSGDYSEVIGRWEKYFPSEQLHYLFYDDLKKSSDDLLIDVCRFLDIDTARGDGAGKHSKRVNMADQEMSMPDAIRDLLVKRYEGEISFLEDRFGRSLEHWRYPA